MVKSTESKPLQTGKEQAPKTLKDLTLLDRFLFDQTMEQPEAHEAVLQIILGKENLHLLTPAQTEKELRTAPWLRSIRLDVYSLDHELTVYNTEMQAEWRGDLVKRSRYYQSLIDSSLLAPGTIKFSTLNYVESPDGDFVQNSDSQRLKTIHACVNQIKSSEEMGVKYMQRLEEEIRMKEKAQAVGWAEGMQQGILIGARTLIRTTGMSASDALSAMGIAENEFDEYLSLLKTCSED